MESCTCRPGIRTRGGAEHHHQRHGNLDSSEIDRMVADAERNRSEDAAPASRSMHGTNWTRPPTGWSAGWPSWGDAVPVHEKARADTLVADARSALNEDAPTERIRSLTASSNRCTTALGRGRSDGDGHRPAGAPEGSDDDVIDAEFTVS